MQLLLKDLIEVYDNNTHEILKMYKSRFDTDYTLLPIYHILNKTHIEIHLNKDGEYIRSKVKAKMIPVPVTEDSLSRGKGVYPHFIHDKLVYLSKDIQTYIEKQISNEYEVYINQLKQFDNPSTKAIVHFLENNDIIQLLVDQNILFLNEQGYLLEESNGMPVYKIRDSSIENLFVRFHVETDSPVYMWEDKEFVESIIQEITDKNLYQKNKSEGMCYITGETTLLANNHPYKIRHVGDLSKLIAEKSGLKHKQSTIPYQDMFSINNIRTKGIGVVNSFKAHNALSWLIAKQGIELNGMIYLLWSNQKKEDLVVESGFDFLEDYRPETDEDLNSLTNETLSKRILNQALGLSADIDTNEEIMFLTLDAFDRNKGTLAILNYQRFEAEKFIEKIQMWTTHSKYIQYFEDENTKTYRMVYKAPSIFDILESLKVQKNFYKMLYRLLLPTFLEGKEVPIFIIKSLREKLMKHRIASIYDWNDIARCYYSCIKYNKYLKGVKLEDSLDEKNTDTAYLTGRLFAYMTYGEDMLAVKKFQKYNPALKYQSIFSNKTENLKNHAYVKNVCNRAKQRGYFTKEHLNEIEYLLTNIKGNINSDDFYIGYLHQYDKLKGVENNELTE